MQPALQVEKTIAQEVISYLKGKGLLDDGFKIVQRLEHVLIPVVDSQIVLPQPWLFELIEFEFEERLNEPNSLKTALHEILPNMDPANFPTSYDQIGHIAIIDIKHNLLNIKKEIGEAIIASNSSILTVYRKTSGVQGEYRIRTLECIAGDDVSASIVKEHGIKISVDVKKAYFSPRLATEHERVVRYMYNGCRMLDLFGSLAPFSLHAAKQYSAICETVDINPEVVPLIEHSIEINKLKGQINVVTMDAKEFVQSSKHSYDFIIMNHPSDAISFLENTMPLLKNSGKLFLYMFVPMVEHVKYVERKLEMFEVKIKYVHIVRQSSPSEYHVCVEIIK